MTSRMSWEQANFTARVNKQINVIFNMTRRFGSSSLLAPCTSIFWWFLNCSFSLLLFCTLVKVSHFEADSWRSGNKSSKLNKCNSLVFHIPEHREMQCLCSWDGVEFHHYYYKWYFLRVECLRLQGLFLFWGLGGTRFSLAKRVKKSQQQLIDALFKLFTCLTTSNLWVNANWAINTSRTWFLKSSFQ